MPPKQWWNIKASADTLCPEGSTAAIDVQPPNGFIYVYSVIEPEAYTRVITWTDGVTVVTDWPPPGQYWGDRIVVCYNPVATVVVPATSTTSTVAPETTTITAPEVGPDPTVTTTPPKRVKPHPSYGRPPHCPIAD